MALRTSLLALPLLLSGTALAGQAVLESQPSTSAAPEAPPFGPCRELISCPDPMQLDKALPPFAREIPEPLQPMVVYPPGKDPGRARTTRTLVMFQDSKLIQIKTVHHPAKMRGAAW